MGIDPNGRENVLSRAPAGTSTQARLVERPGAGLIFKLSRSKKTGAVIEAPGEAAMRTPLPSGAYARFLRIGAVAGYVFVVLVAAIFWQSPATQKLLSNSILLTSSILATVVCLAASRILPRPGSNIWLAFGIAGLLATVSQAAQLLLHGQIPLTGLHLLWLGSYACFFIGIVTAVHLNERGRLTELLLDVGLVVTAAALVMVRWAPGAYVVTTGASTATILLVVFGPVVGLSSMLLGSVLFTTPAPTVSRNALLGIIFAISALMVSTLPQILTGGSCCHAGSHSVVGVIGLWLGLVYAAAGELGAGEQRISSAAGERLRSFVAPTVAIVLATISIEGAVNPPLGPRTAFALGVLGALVALRLTELLNATRMQVAERRELAQTRALVEVSRALAGKNDLDATLRIVTQWAVRVLHAKAATVELLSSDARMLELRAADGLPESTIGMKFPVDNSFTGWVIMNGEARVTTDPRHDPFISEASLVYLGDSPVAAMPLRYRERLLGVLTCIGTRPFEGEDLDLLRAFANQTAVALEDARLFDQVRALSVTDPLTGLANRRQLDRELTREFAAAQRGRRLVAVMFDLDDFKQHNDKYGHVAGDEALKLFADALQTTTRTMNLASRYGGDEFFALLADADLHGAEIFIQRAKDRFRRSMDAAGWPVLKVSAGMAEYTPEMKTPEELVQAADRALYVAKFEADVNA